MSVRGDTGQLSAAISPGRERDARLGGSVSGVLGWGAWDTRRTQARVRTARPTGALLLVARYCVPDSLDTLAPNLGRDAGT